VGRDGTVIAEEGPSKLLEIADQKGVHRDLVSACDESLELIWNPATHSRADADSK